MSFSEQLRGEQDAVWQAQLGHPFVRAVIDGSLGPDRFGVWLQQDYLRLVDCVRLFGLACARSPDADAMRWATAAAHGVLHGEMLLHQAYAFVLAGSADELGRAAKLPTTLACTDHLLRVGGTGGYLELVAAVLPALWAPAEIGQRLRGGPTPSRRYGRWVDWYSGPGPAALARRSRELLDRLAADSSPGERARAASAFAHGSRYGWLFFEMCWGGA
jgi:thiaminase/transcriptional activator TenA